MEWGASQQKNGAINVQLIQTPKKKKTTTEQNQSDPPPRARTHRAACNTRFMPSATSLQNAIVQKKNVNITKKQGKQKKK